jgi:hypothetical protein
MLDEKPDGGGLQLAFRIVRSAADLPGIVHCHRRT